MKENIAQLKKAITEAKARQNEASKDVKRIEKDMKDFDSNKDSKLAELQSSLVAMRKNQTKSLGSVKVLQKYAQESRLESEQLGGDLETARGQLEESDTVLKTHDAEMQELLKEQSSIKVWTASSEPSTVTDCGRTPMR